MKNNSPKILVFGATGRTGQIIIRKLLKKGYQVTAFARNIKKLRKIQHPSFCTELGSIHNYSDVLKATHKHDVVISALGTSRVLPNTIVSKGVTNIIAAMKESKVKNLIFQSSLGVGDSKGQLGILYNFVLLPFLLWFIFKDKERQEALIINSDLNWTIIRPAHFIPFSLPKSYRVILSPKRPRILPIMSRFHTADFIAKNCEDSQYNRQKVALSYF